MKTRCTSSQSNDAGLLPEGIEVQSRASIGPRRSALFIAVAACLGGIPYALAQDKPAGEDLQGPNDPDQVQESREDNDDEDSAELESVSVVGFRSSINRAISEKRNNSSIVEAVFAEEIGKLPDVSIAESLARLPGLTSQRVDGRSQTISIRGLGPDFSTALLNGREQVTTGDNRGVEFDQYPAELLGSVVVYKTPDSTLIGQGLAGTVDLRTIRPLDADEQVLSVSARGEFTEEDSFNPDGDDTGYRASAIYIDQFMDNTLGVTLGFATQSTPQQIERFNAWGFPNADDGNLVPGGAKPFVQSNDLDRTGLIGTLEWKPSDNFSTTLDLSYSDFEEEQILRGIEVPLAWSGTPVNLRDERVVDDGLIVEGTFDGVRPVLRNDLNKRDAELFTFGLNTRFEFAELWGVESDLSFSRAEREDELIETLAGTGPGALGLGPTVSMGFSIAPNGVFQFSPDFDFTDTSQLVITDPQGWGAGANPPVTQAGFINAPETEDWLAHARFHIDRVILSGPISRVTVGTDLSRRDKDRTLQQAFLTPPGNAAQADIPEGAILGSNVSLGFIGIPGMAALNTRFLVNNFLEQFPIQLSSFNVPQDWNVREDVLTNFVRFDIDTLIAGRYSLTGNFGLQHVYTDQESTGFRVAGAEAGAGTAEGNFVPNTDGATYNKYLPSLNLSLDMGNNFLTRLGASRVMARPRMDQLNAGLALNTNFNQLTSTDVNQAFFSAGGGNAKLRPMMANTVDLSFEKYYADGEGYIAITGFYKDLEDFINPSDSFETDFSQFVDDFLTPEQAAQLGTTLGTTSGPTNRGDGTIKGFEFSTSVPFGFFVPQLDGFGLLFNASYSDSNVKLGDDTKSTTVPGLSEWVVSTTGFFEKRGFQARISHRYRDEFLSEIFGLSATRITRSAKSESIIDAQIGYQLQAGPLEGLNIVLQGNNLTDEPFTTFEGGDGRLVIDTQDFGRNYLIGANFTF
ncbi:MAG: TonB-dependent receptor [Wenzhouxiangellaceae bacterium]|nr:TonB-dependent receptor [Wenzhouxiangellaceae bacterium]